MIHHHLYHPPLPVINAAVTSSHENSFSGICCPQLHHLGLDFSNYPCSTDEEAGAYLSKEANAFSLEFWCTRSFIGQFWLFSLVFVCAHCQAPLPFPSQGPCNSPAVPGLEGQLLPSLAVRTWVRASRPQCLHFPPESALGSKCAH